jgi:O-Antigen ligase
MAKIRAKARSIPEHPSKVLESVLLGLCLCVMALRATYTEAPTANTSTLPGSLTDTIYSLTISGLLIAALLLWLVRGLWRGNLTYHVTGIEIGLGLFLLAGAISGFSATDKRLAITHTMMLLGPIVAAILLVQLLDSAARIRLVLLVIGALGIVSAYRCVEQIRTDNQWTIEEYEKAPKAFLDKSNMTFELDSLQHFMFEHRLYSRDVSGFFTTSNSAASFSLMAAFAAFALLLIRPVEGKSKTSRTHPLLYPGLATAIVVAGLLLTQSKGGILGGLVAASLFGLWFLLRRWLAAHRKTALILFGTLVLIVISGVGYAAVSYGLEHGRLPGGNSMLVRWQYWRATAQMVADHPVTGIGPGNFAQNYPHYKPAAALESVADPHNFPLSFLAQYGPLGLIGFLVMVLVPLGTNAISAAKDGTLQADRPSSSARRLILTMLGVMIATMLLIRPILIPTASDGAGEVMLYAIVVLYVAPVAAFLIGFLLLAAPLESEFAEREGSAWTPTVVLLACSIVGVLVHNLIDFAIFEPGVWTAFWMLIACLSAAGIRRRRRCPITLPNRPALRPVALVFALVIAGAYFHFVWHPVYSTTTKIQQAQYAASRGQREQAHRLLDAASAADPLSSASLSLNGRLYLQESEYAGGSRAVPLKKAATCFQKATDLDPADYKNYEKAGMVHHLLGQNQQAYDWYLKAAQRYPGCGRLHFQLGQIADRFDGPNEAQQHYAVAVRVEEAFRAQFREMYPERENVVSRLGEANYQLAKRRIEELSK